MNISNGYFFTGNSNTFIYSDISSYTRLQSLNSDSKQTTGRINLKLTRVTPVGIEGFEELSTAYKFLVSEAQSKKPQNQRLPYKLVDKWVNKTVLEQLLNPR